MFPTVPADTPHDIAQRMLARVRCDRRSHAAVLALLAVLLMPTVGRAQDEPDPAAKARMRIGPVAFTPTLSTNFGVDTNVFNEADSPDRDLVGNVQPHADAWLRLGRGRLSASGTVDFVYFRQFESERSVNTQNRVQLELVSPRIRPYASVSFVNTRQRLNYEIDTRARYVQRVVTAGVDVGLGARTRLGVAAGRGDFAFGEGERDVQADLRELLNRDTDTLTLSVRQRLTPLTTLVLSAQRAQEHFEFSPLRDNESFSVTPGVEFSPFALLNGSAFVGYRRFAPEGTIIPEYSGVTASVDLGYTLLGSTRFGMRANRDVAYSVEELQPYYVLTAFEGSVARRLTEAWEVLGSVGQQRLAYRRVQAAGPAVPGGPPAPVPPVPGGPPAPVPPVPGAPPDPIAPTTGAPPDGRTDTVLTFLAGVRYWLGRDTRVGLNVDYFRRGSEAKFREFRGMRVNSVVTYGF